MDTTESNTNPCTNSKTKGQMGLVLHVLHDPGKTGNHSVHYNFSTALAVAKISAVY